MIEAILLVSSLASSLASSSDVVVGLAIAIPVVVVAGGVAVGLRLRGRGVKEHVPLGEEALDAPTDIELDRSADATRAAEGTPAATGSSGAAVIEVELPPGPEATEPAEPAERWRNRPSRPSRRPSRPPFGAAWARHGVCSPVISEPSDPKARSTQPPGTTWRRR